MMFTTAGGGLFSWIDGEDLQKLELEEGDVHRIEWDCLLFPQSR